MVQSIHQKQPQALQQYKDTNDLDMGRQQPGTQWEVRFDPFQLEHASTENQAG